jgi:hypothetical protein
MRIPSVINFRDPHTDGLGKKLGETSRDQLIGHEHGLSTCLFQLGSVWIIGLVCIGGYSSLFPILLAPIDPFSPLQLLSFVSLITVIGPIDSPHTTWLVSRGKIGDHRSPFHDDLGYRRIHLK